MKKLLLVAFAVALGLVAGLLLAYGGQSRNVQNVVTHVSKDVKDVRQSVGSVKTAVTRVVHPHRCSDNGDPSGDDTSQGGAASCSNDDQAGDNGSDQSDDQAGDNVSGGP
jgi:hypothetical protein